MIPNPVLIVSAHLCAYQYTYLLTYLHKSVHVNIQSRFGVSNHVIYESLLFLPRVEISQALFVHFPWKFCLILLCIYCNFVFDVFDGQKFQNISCAITTNVLERAELI